MERLRRFTTLPIAVGFGISTAEHVAAVGEFADAAVIGTAIVSLIEKAEPGTAPARIAAFLQGLRQVARCSIRIRAAMDIVGWREKIDELDRQIVALISARAQAAQEIGKLKRSTSLPVYEPNRERVIFENVRAANHGPLPDIELTHIYERIIDVMRALQKDELASRSKPGETGK